MPCHQVKFCFDKRTPCHEFDALAGTRCFLPAPGQHSGIRQSNEVHLTLLPVWSVVIIVILIERCRFTNVQLPSGPSQLAHRAPNTNERITDLSVRDRILNQAFSELQSQSSFNRRCGNQRCQAGAIHSKHGKRLRESTERCSSECHHSSPTHMLACNTQATNSGCHRRCKDKRREAGTTCTWPQRLAAKSPSGTWHPPLPPNSHIHTSANVPRKRKAEHNTAPRRCIQRAPPAPGLHMHAQTTKAHA